MRWVNRIKTLQPRVILGIGYALFLLYAFPGYMSNDSTWQLAQARQGVYSDANPPLMAVEWFVLDRIISGPVLMMLFQSTLFLGSLYVILKRYVSPRAAAWCAIGIMLFPPVMTPMAVVWKDSHMAAYFLAGIAALLHPTSRRWRLAGLALICAGCLMRHNALAAGAPLVGILFEWKNPIRWYKRLGMIVGAAVLALGALLGASRLIARQHAKLTPVFYDVMGMVAFSDDMTDEEARYLLRDTNLAIHENIQENARRIFELRGVYRAVVGDDHFFDPPHTEKDWDALNRAWRDLFKRDPGSYFAAHWAVFRRVIGVDERPRAPVYNLYFERLDAIPEVQHAAFPSTSAVYMGHFLYFLADDTPMFKPWIYLVVLLLFLVLLCRDRITLGLLTSGLLYELSFIPPFAEEDYRYSHWMITMVALSAVILFIQRYRARTA